MTVELRVLSGARAGQRERFEKSLIAIGRHPLSDLRFDPEGDRDVSARHAEIRIVDGRAVLRDTNSTNGTFVNGARLTAERELRPGDLIAFGEQGPRVEYHVVHEAADRPPAFAVPSPPPAERLQPGAGSDVPEPPRPRRTTGERIAVAVREHTRTLRHALYALAALLVAGIGSAYWMGQREASAREAQLDALLRRNATLSEAYDAEIRRMAGTVTGLDSALAAAKRETDELRQRISTERRSDARTASVDEWSSRLAMAEVRHQRLVSAATLDASAIAEMNNRAVALIAVETPDGKAYSGTAFGVTRGGLLVTNRHLVEDHQSRPVRRVMVIFADTRQWLPARVVKTSETDDLAFLQIDVAGEYPAVRSIAAESAEAPAVGAPVVLIGYPLGTATAGMGGDLSRITARSTLGVGTVSKRLGDVLQIDAFAGEGSSGSPVFDARGRVAGVVYGGATESGGRIVYAVPAARLAAQLPTGALAGR